ncbi:PREDICTED: retinaldehyde-binding protein 1-like [Nicrophorus vespilloides]|uniref:Retinaldehyde-binding protein 1-like n=1 Tax=Nicrophorus vespilloides TaxID=110193 RepID=A0ABM1M2T4_NICVS|nr:PREDICTED: retinaldehyde-binding protein 1-like [Nicrophorus vespilloides]
MSVDLQSKTSLCHYTEENVHKILEIHGKKLKDLEIDLETIKQWFKMQPHIPETPSDRLIVSYLIMNKFSIEKTKSRLEMNYSIRNVMPEFYCPLHPKILESYRYCKLIAMPKLTKDLRRLCIIKYEDEPSFDVTIIFSRVIMFFELLAMYDINNGDEYISDCRNVNLSIITKTKPTDFKKMVALFDKVYANRFSVIHTVNLSSVGVSVFNMIKSLMKPKLRERMLMHKDIESLKQYYSLDILPKDYGGSCKSLDETADEHNTFLKGHDEFIEMDKNSC